MRLALHRTQHAVDEPRCLGATLSIASRCLFCQLDSLKNRGVRGDAIQMHQLKRAEAEDVAVTHVHLKPRIDEAVQHPIELLLPSDNAVDKSVYKSAFASAERVLSERAINDSRYRRASLRYGHQTG